ncbi:MAG: polyprenyl synthetase family protein [Anaerolineae bacterium]|nr:polyprenyl synthetase family protein [Anaerolineae bacterium]
MKVLPFLEPIREELSLVEAKIRGMEDVGYAPLVEAFSTLMGSGGKRLRPAVVILCSKFFQVELARVVALAAAVETLHTATLVHDDVIDGALIRRGHPTLNAIWSSEATVLAGDYLFARAAGFAAETGSVEVMRSFARTLKTICDGELRQLFSTLDWDQPREAYYQRIFSKTASLFLSAAESVGLLAEAPEDQMEALRSFGYNLGMAFQIVDDILDFVGDEQVMGKPVGSDLRQGTITLPVFYFMQQHPEVEVPALYAREGVDRVIDLVRNSEAIQAAQDEAEAFADQAVRALGIFPDGPYLRTMRALAEYVVARRW